MLGHTAARLRHYGPVVQPTLAEQLGRPLTEREAEILAAHRMGRHAIRAARNGVLGVVKPNYWLERDAIAAFEQAGRDVAALLADVLPGRRAA